MKAQVKLFADLYAKTGNGTQSAIDAGYSPKSAYSQASRLLKNPKVSEYIRSLQADATADTGVTVMACVEELREIAFGEGKAPDKLRALELLMKYQGAFEKDNQQRALLDVSSLTPAELALLAGMYAKVNK